MDRPRDGVPPLATVDLHLHTTASDGSLAPSELVARARAAGLAAIAITDHDTTAGVAAAIDAGARLGVRVVSGCEFSVAAPWGEMHLLGYFLPLDSPDLEDFLARCRRDRERRAEDMVTRLRAHGVPIEVRDVAGEAAGGAVGRPHVARALLRRGVVGTVEEAFDRFIARGRPCFVEKRLPAFAEVADLVHRLGGVVSAAHLGERGTRAALRRFQAEGLDAVETRHPAHHPDRCAWLTESALALGLLRTGGSDWHGDPAGGYSLGSQDVPIDWLEALEDRRPARATEAS
ncbi:MAG TPA: PHP domain-containing protein [Gemmatimonadales bacterium]|nr:PHP domain-containing protein [Gemmatimonadales bacterium]